ncbi:MAG: DUF1015 domain-containing protein [Candidatus Omnitrophota bacterium]
MPEIRGFRGWRYNPAKVKDLAGVFAPPYDVISTEGQERLYRESAVNVVRLILGREERADNARDNRYTRARRFLENWISSRVLVRDEAPSVYVYAQDYKEKGRVLSRVGFIAAMKLDERAVLKHENTLASPKKDRMALLKEVRANLSPIFGLFEDKNAGVQKILRQTLRLKPSVDVRIDGVRHRLYIEQNPERLKALSRAMRSKPMHIADGHHRFEVACQFKNWMSSRFPRTNNAGWKYVMAYFTDCLHNPFTIYPTHRLLAVPGRVKDPLGDLAKRGELVRVPNVGTILKRLSQSRSELARPRYAFGVYTKRNGFFLFTLGKKFERGIGKNAVERLDVAVLHKTLIEPCFGIKAIEKSKAIDFTRDPQEACRKVKSGKFDMALFLRPTSLPEMLEASHKGLKMPQKSTYFYPKLLSGLVFHRFDEEGVK